MTILNFPVGEAFASQAIIRWMQQLVHAFNNSRGTGTTAQRPIPAPEVGFMYYDTTINRPIWAKTLTQYVDASGLNV